MERYIVEVQGGQIVGQPVPYSEPEVQGVGVSSSGTSIGILVILLVFVFFAFFIVRQQTVKIIQRLGKFNKLATPGLGFKIPFLDWVAGEVDMKIQQLMVHVETKTLDNVFVKVPVAVQFYVTPEKVYDAFYKLSDPLEQISSYVFDVVRSEVPKLKLDEVFEKKETIALAIKSELQQTMDDFGYTIIQALVTDIDPDSKVKDSMNEINAAARLRMAASENAEANKIITVKAAEAEAESKELQGRGIANQRKAIIAGLRESVQELSEATKIKEEDVMNLVLLTQYFDTIKDVGTHAGTRTIFLPSTPSGMQSLSSEIRNVILSANEVKN